MEPQNKRSFPAGPSTIRAAKLEIPLVPAKDLAELLQLIRRTPFRGVARIGELQAAVGGDAAVLLESIRALRLLCLIDEGDGVILVNRRGQQLASAGPRTRRDLFACQILRRVPLIRRLFGILCKEGSVHRDRLLRELRCSMAAAAMNRALKTAADWGCFAQLLTYDGTSREFRLTHHARSQSWF